MSRISVAKAVSLGYTSQATIYRDMRTGAISYERNGKNRRLIDISELTRVYGEPQTPPPESDTHRESENSQTTPQTHIDKDKIITILETQNATLTTQIAEERAEKAKLLEMLSTEQDKTKMLMIAPPAQPNKPLFSFMRLFRKA